MSETGKSDFEQKPVDLSAFVYRQPEESERNRLQQKLTGCIPNWSGKSEEPEHCRSFIEQGSFTLISIESKDLPSVS